MKPKTRLAIETKTVRVYQGSCGKPWRRTAMKAYIDAAWTAVIREDVEDAGDEYEPFGKFSPEWWALGRKACRLARWLMWRDGVMTPARKRSFQRYERNAVLEMGKEEEPYP